VLTKAPGAELARRLAARLPRCLADLAGEEEADIADCPAVLLAARIAPLSRRSLITWWSI